MAVMLPSKTATVQPCQGVTKISIRLSDACQAPDREIVLDDRMFARIAIGGVSVTLALIVAATALGQRRNVGRQSAEDPTIPAPG